MRWIIPCLMFVVGIGAGCAGADPVRTPEKVGTLEFVESWPQETMLDLPELRDAPGVWPEVLGSARTSIDLAGFYFSRKGDGDDSYGPPSAPDLFLPVLQAVTKSAERGVHVRTLADAKFYKTYPTVPGLLNELPGAEMRIFDAGEVFGGGGVLHAKYFLVDEDRFFIGSQNFDWRSLGQIHELGVLVNHRELARDLHDVFEFDWSPTAREKFRQDATAGRDESKPTSIDDLARHEVRLPDGSLVRTFLTASPENQLPPQVPWDLPLLVQMIDSARDSVHVQLLSYGVTDRHKRVFDDLHRALQRAAVRGVQVRIILANWSKRSYSLPWIKALALLPHLEVRFTNIPEHPDGFIPFARVEHAKYLTVDGNRLWIGTSNWSRDYFYSSRNVGLILCGEGATRDPDRFFNQSWHGPYAETVDPCAEYSPPRRN